MYTLEQLQGKSLAELKEIGQQLNVSPGDRRRRQSWIDARDGINPPLLAMLEASPAAIASVIEHEQAEPIVETAKASPAAEIEEVQEPIESKFGRIVYPRPASKIESQMSQSAIVPTVETFPGVKTDRVPEAIAEAAKNSTGVEIDPVPEAIAEAAKNSTGVEIDPVPEAIEQAAENSTGVGIEKFKAQHICQSSSGNGSTFAAESVPDSLMPAFNSGRKVQTFSSRETLTLPESSGLDSPAHPLLKRTSTPPTGDVPPPQTFSPHRRHASRSQPTEKNLEPPTNETASQQSSRLSQQYNQSLLSLKMCPDFYLAHTGQVWNEEPISGILCGSYTSLGTMRSGKFLAAPPLELPGGGKDCLLLPSPGALSSVNGRPPGSTRLEDKLRSIGILHRTEVCNPQFLEAAYHLPVGWTDPQETRSAIDLVQAQKSASASRAKTELSDSDGFSLAMPLTGELRALPLDEFSISPITFSDRFLARYYPPQPEFSYAVSDNGQLSLLSRDVLNEPPDPDDFESLDAFREALARWDAEHPEKLAASFSPCDRPAPAQKSLDVRVDRPVPNSLQTQNDALTGTVIRAGTTSVPAERDFCTQHDGASCDRQDERLAGQKGDRLLEKSGADSGNLRGVLSCQPAQLDNDKRPTELAIGMLVGRRSSRRHIGKILNIYQSRRGIWRAKIQPLNKSNFVYFDCAALIEQRLLYDYEMRLGGFVLTGEIFNKARCEHFEVFSRKQKPPALTDWTADELNSLSIFKLKQIARDMQIQSIPGAVGKRSLIRAILAEQAIVQERRTAQLEQQAGRAIAQKQKSAPPANKRKRAREPLLGDRLSLFDVAV